MNIAIYSWFMLISLPNVSWHVTLVLMVPLVIGNPHIDLGRWRYISLTLQNPEYPKPQAIPKKNVHVDARKTMFFTSGFWWKVVPPNYLSWFMYVYATCIDERERYIYIYVYILTIIYHKPSTSWGFLPVNYHNLLWNMAHGCSLIYLLNMEILHIKLIPAEPQRCTWGSSIKVPSSACSSSRLWRRQLEMTQWGHSLLVGRSEPQFSYMEID